MQAGDTRTGGFSGLSVASVLLHSHCDEHAIYFLITLSLIRNVLKRRLISPGVRIVISLINTVEARRHVTAGKMAQMTLK